MTSFEENENSLNCLYDSDVNSVISDSDYDLDEDIEMTDSDEDDISVVSDLCQYKTDEEESNAEESNAEEEEDVNSKYETIEDYKLKKLKILIDSILNKEIETIKELKQNDLIDNEDINMMYYFQREDKDNYSFKISALRIIFAKIIIMMFNDNINIGNITGLSITINPLEIKINGLNNDEAELIHDFFIMYLESK